MFVDRRRCVRHPCLASISATAAWKASQEAKRRRVPSILHLHGNFDVLYPQWSRVRKLGFRRALAVADRLVVLSEGWRRWFAAHRGDGCIDVVRNGVDVSRFQPRANDAARETVRLLFVGTRHATLKGAYDILAVIPAVLREAPGARFVFAGEDAERIEERCVRGTPLAPPCAPSTRLPASKASRQPDESDQATNRA